jgi:hypothetical protein
MCVCVCVWICLSPGDCCVARGDVCRWPRKAVRPRTTRSERDKRSRSVGQSVLEGCNRAGYGETKGVGYLQARAVLYSSSDGWIVSMRATVGDVDSTSQQFTGIE